MLNEKELQSLLEEIKARGLSPEREKIILKEMGVPEVHEVRDGYAPRIENDVRQDYSANDFKTLQNFKPSSSPSLNLYSLEDLIKRDEQREKDGFPKKIRWGEFVKPVKGGQPKVIVVPVTEEEKFYHDPSDEPEEVGGSGEGEEGDVVGEKQVREEQGSGSKPGGDGSGEHDIESRAYEVGKYLTQQWKLPNIQDKKKKKSVPKDTYDLTDKNRRSGQFLDENATLEEIIKTNVALGIIDPKQPIDPKKLIIDPNDIIYKVFSRERHFESQALVFFVRDYSGSMGGRPEEVVVRSHLLIYSWLMYQYQEQVKNRFVLHSTEAKEVDDFYSYYHLSASGGTQIISGFKLVNEIIKKENLARDYNVYVFYGSDGDDWGGEQKETIDEINQLLTYVSRLGILIVNNQYGESSETTFEKYVKESNVLKEKPALIRLDTIRPDEDPNTKMMDCIKHLISD
ncbi:MAG: DUF444 family protein [Nanoarchaeota archaeon]